jgi:hypothetical protein
MPTSRSDNHFKEVCRWRSTAVGMPFEMAARTACACSRLGSHLEVGHHHNQGITHCRTWGTNIRAQQPMNHRMPGTARPTQPKDSW